jgi:hypothetical protein
MMLHSCMGQTWVYNDLQYYKSIISLKEKPTKLQYGISRNSPPNNICKCKRELNKGT